MKYSITCIQRPPKGSNKSGLLQQVVLKCRFYLVDVRRGIISEQWSVKAVDYLIKVVCNTGLTHSHTMTPFDAPGKQVF